MASRSTRSTGRRKMIVGMTLVGHERSFYYVDGERKEDLWGPAIAYFPDGQKIISGSADKTTRLWDLQAGKEIEEARVVGEQKVDAMAVSSDGRWVVTGGLGGVHKVKANEVKAGSVKTFEGRSLGITCVDISMDSKLLASGSRDRTVRVWSLDIGELVAGPFGSSDLPGGVGAVRFSHDSRKLAVKSGFGSWLEVWDIQAQKLDNKVGTGGDPSLPRVPVFWTTKDRTIVAAFCFTDGKYDPPKTIYEFDSSTLETVGTPFEGHTGDVSGLALSNDSTLLASASFDRTIKLWAFESRQLIASFDDTLAYSLALSPDSHKLAYTTFNHGPPNIYIYDIPPNILASVWPAQEAVKTIEHEHSQPSDLLKACDPADAARRPAAISRRPRRRSPAIYPQQPTFIHQLRKLLPSSFRRNRSPVHYDERRDLLNVPAPSRLSPSGPPSGQAATHVHSGVDYDENPRLTSAPAITQSSATASAIGKAQRCLLSWWSSNIGRTPVSIVDVPLAPGRLRTAISGAPQVHEDDLVRAEDFDSSNPSPNPNLQQLSKATIYEFDSSTLETVGTPFEGHTGDVSGLALSNDSTLLASASFDRTIKLWAFESRQLIASFDDTLAYSLALSPDSHKLAYTTFNHGPPNIYIYDIPPNILASVWPAQEAVKTIEHEHSQPSDQLKACDPADATRRPAAVSRRPRRRSPAIYPQQPTFIHQLRKLLPSSFRRNRSPVHYDERRDLLNVPAPSRLSPSGPPSGQAATHVHSGVDYDENPRRTSAPAITQSSATASAIGKAQRCLLSWWSSNIGRTPVSIVDVPLAPGRLRTAISGAPQVHEDDLVRAEDFDSSNPSPNPNLQQLSKAVQINTTEHRSRPCCFCL
ncbi:WD40 repeat-like protein [Rhizopogon salebrosus TDB-379]|nr:WD40 repeat-like protein [Rhizopogon salebrosus TDB-379]